MLTPTDFSFMETLFRDPVAIIVVGNVLSIYNHGYELVRRDMEDCGFGNHPIVLNPKSNTLDGVLDDGVGRTYIIRQSQTHIARVGQVSQSFHTVINQRYVTSYQHIQTNFKPFPPSLLLYY
jgi:hypothetical protein